MAWIEVHQTLPSHRKTLDLAARLNIEPVQALGHLVTLWLWTLDNAPEGKIGHIHPAVVAKAAQWNGDGGAFFQALVGAKFIDAEPEPPRIHDWMDYAGKLIDKRRRDAERKKSERDSKDSAGMSDGHPTDGAGNRTVPNLEDKKDNAVAKAPAAQRPKKEPREEPAIGPEAKQLATALYDALKARNATPAGKGWFMKQAGIAQHTLLPARPAADWQACMEWAFNEPYWSQNLSNMGQLGDRVWPQYARKAAGRAGPSNDLLDAIRSREGKQDAPT